MHHGNTSNRGRLIPRCQKARRLRCACGRTPLPKIRASSSTAVVPEASSSAPLYISSPFTAFPIPRWSRCAESNTAESRSLGSLPRKMPSAFHVYFCSPVKEESKFNSVFAGRVLKHPGRISAYLQNIETVAQRGGATFDLYWQLRQILSFFLEMPGVFGADHFDGRDCSSRGKCSETCPLFFPVAGSVNNKNDACPTAVSRLHLRVCLGSALCLGSFLSGMVDAQLTRKVSL